MRARLVLWVFVGIAAVVLFLPILLGSGTFSLLVTLALGWSSFLQRTVPRLTWNWDLIGMALVSISIILFLAHKFLNGLSKSIAAKRGTAWSWPWKWTWSSLVALMLLFLVGMAVGGTAHQNGWIAASPESFLERPADPWQIGVEMGILESLGISSGDTEGKMKEVRRDFWKAKDENFPKQDVMSLLQKYHVLVVVDDQGTIQDTIIFPRDSLLREKFGGRNTLYGGKHNWESISGLLEKHQGHLVAF